MNTDTMHHPTQVELKGLVMSLSISQLTTGMADEQMGKVFSILKVL